MEILPGNSTALVQLFDIYGIFLLREGSIWQIKAYVNGYII